MSVQLFKPHPWHGIPIGENCPNSVTAYIEMVPADTVKYEIDKETGYRKVDRPQKFSNYLPALYGFVPQTYCDELIREYAELRSGKTVNKGDGDPLDAMVLLEYPLFPGVVVEVRPVGVLPMEDDGGIDEKILCVPVKDKRWAHIQDINDVPQQTKDEIEHFFTHYKDLEPGKWVKVGTWADKATAERLIAESIERFKSEGH
jgi:inorganic pyrophosphatase